MPLQIALAAVSSAAFIAAGAVSSPEWANRRQILASLRLRKQILVPQGRWLLGLAIFGIVTGIPSALGLIPGLILVPFGGLVIVHYVRTRLAENYGGDVRWLAVLGLCSVSLASRLEAIDTTAIQGAQAVLGPSILIRPFESAVFTALALIAGLVSAVFVVSRSEPLTDQVSVGVEPLLRWGETALAVSLVSAAAAGPSIAVLGRGPFDLMLIAAVGASTIFGLACTAGVSYLRRHANRVPERSLLIGTAGLATLSLFLQLLIV